MSRLPQIAAPKRKPYQAWFKRCWMGGVEPITTFTKRLWASQKSWLKGNSLWYFLRSTHRLSMGNATSWFTTSHHSIWLFPKMAAERNMGANSWPVTLTNKARSRQRNKFNSCDRWLSIGQNQRKKGAVCGFDSGKKVKGRKRHIVQVLSCTKGSSLNMVEIELSVLSRQCLKRRIPNLETIK